MDETGQQDQSVGGGERPETTRTVPCYSPVTDIYETKDALVLLLEMPGVGPDGMTVSLDKRVLTIHGRCQPTAPQGATLTHAEFRDGDFERAFTLSEEIDSANIQASSRDGVLRLVLPKAGPAPAQTIRVTSE